MSLRNGINSLHFLERKKQVLKILRLAVDLVTLEFNLLVLVNFSTCRKHSKMSNKAKSLVITLVATQSGTRRRMVNGWLPGWEGREKKEGVDYLDRGMCVTPGWEKS